LCRRFLAFLLILNGRLGAAGQNLARFWRGRPQQARELLAAVYGWFTEGYNTRDLKEAN
jgi:hypothetical protein